MNRLLAILFAATLISGCSGYTKTRVIKHPDGRIETITEHKSSINFFL